MLAGLALGLGTGVGLGLGTGAGLGASGIGLGGTGSGSAGAGLFALFWGDVVLGIGFAGSTGAGCVFWSDTVISLVAIWCSRLQPGSTDRVAAIINRLLKFLFVYTGVHFPLGQALD
jgi:hypothetical protein